MMQNDISIFWIRDILWNMFAPLSLVFGRAFICDSQGRLVTKEFRCAKIFLLQNLPSLV